MSNKLGQTMGTESPITDADIAAFKHNHALDSRIEQRRMDVGSDQFVVEERVVFEIFHFHEQEVGEIIFDVRGIKDALAARAVEYRMYETPLVEAWVEHIRDKGGVEVERMKSLTAADLERPAIAIFWPHNGYTTVIDGNNRLVRRWDDGVRTVRLAVVPLGKTMFPYMCRPGKEEQFLERRAKEDPRGMMHLGGKRVGVVGIDCDEHGEKIT